MNSDDILHFALRYGPKILILVVAVWGHISKGQRKAQERARKIAPPTSSPAPTPIFSGATTQNKPQATPNAPSAPLKPLGSSPASRHKPREGGPWSKNASPFDS